MTVNAPMLYQVLGFLETHPEQWNQSDWSVVAAGQDPVQDPFACGARGCFAGWAAIFAGARWKPNTSMLQDSNGQGIGVHISDYAREVLGLTASQADRLFSGSNSIDEMKRLIREYTAPPARPRTTEAVKIDITPLNSDDRSSFLDEIGSTVNEYDLELEVEKGVETDRQIFDRLVSEGRLTRCECQTRENASGDPLRCNVNQERLAAAKAGTTN